MYFVTTMRCCFLDNKQQMKFSLILSYFGKRTCNKIRCEGFLRIGKRNMQHLIFTCYYSSLTLLHLNLIYKQR